METPILSRTCLFRRLRDNTLQQLDWFVVTTTLGRMLEPRTLVRATGNMQNDRVYASNFTDIQVITDADGVALGVLGALGGGDCWPRVYNTL